MTTPEGRKASPHYIDMLKSWRAREAEIVAGKVIPWHRDRMAGHSPYMGSAVLDLQQLLDVELDRDVHSEELFAALARCRAVQTASAVWAAAMAIPEDLYDIGYGELRQTLIWHAALRGHRPAVGELLVLILTTPNRAAPLSWLRGLMLAVGLAVAGGNEDLEDEQQAASGEDARGDGIGRLERMRDLLVEYHLDVDALDRPADAEEAVEPAAKSGMMSALARMKAAQQKASDEAATSADLDAEFMQAVLEDRAESYRPSERLVVDADPEQKQPSSRSDIWKAYKSVIGAPLPLVSTAAVPQARTVLHARYPHMHVEIDTILGTQAALQSIKLSVLLVGDPGSGKTSFARELGERLGLPTMVYSCAGASDGAFGGTSAQWTNSRPSTPMQHVGRSQVANPLILLDEVDKIGDGRNNGNLSDTLLTFLEPVSSRVVYDLALEVPVDLSAVSYIATANELSDVPAALRDRFKIVRIPSPGFEHIGVLSQRIIDDLARERGLDRRWLEPLAQDETDLVRRSWEGGSLRQLTRIVTMLIDGREALMGRA